MICAKVFHIIINNIAVIDTDWVCLYCLIGVQIYVKEVRKKNTSFKILNGAHFSKEFKLIYEYVWQSSKLIFEMMKPTRITSIPSDSQRRMISFMNANKIKNRGDCSLRAHFNFAFSLAPIIKDRFIDNQNREFVTVKTYIFNTS